VTQTLLVSQLAALKLTLQNSRIPFEEFRFEVRSVSWTTDEVPAVVHEPTNFSFAISYTPGYRHLGRHEPAGFYVLQNPGTQSVDETVYSPAWDGVLDRFRLWLILIARELDLPGIVGPTSFPRSGQTTEGVVWAFLHPEILAIAKPRMEAGHFADAVEASLKHVNALLQQRYRKLTNEDLDGSKLVKRLFSVENPLLMFGDLSTQTGKSMQIGYMELFSGAMTGIRNPKAHANVAIDERRALHFLFVASLLRFKIDETTIA
jgi:uncharacterized protein (TIGR02391 family)